ncbi:hypothetical protein [Enhygromyxa salina]|nr:hypothetical protein [Enhygromyxa salina]
METTEPLTDLIALARELEEIAPWWRGWAEPITPAAISRFETANEITLPPGYRGVLEAIGDHAPVPVRPGGALARLAEATALPTTSAFLGPLDSPFPHSGSAPVELAWDEDADDYADPLWLRGCLPLAEAGCDESSVLVVSGPDRGRVWDVTPSGSPQLHPTGLEFTSWYRRELERGLAPERARVAELAALERRVADDEDDVEAAVALGRAVLVQDRAQAATLIERAWARVGPDPSVHELDRAITELDLLTGRLDRIEALAERDGPWLRAHAGIAAARAGADRRAIELFAAGGHPATLSQLVAGYHALALWRDGQARRALEVLRAGATGLANVALAAQIQTELGEVEAARQRWQRVRLGLIHAVQPKPRRPQLADFIALPCPDLPAVEAALNAAVEPI